MPYAVGADYERFLFPGILALISNIVEMYIDGSKLCNHMRRPLAQRGASSSIVVLDRLTCSVLLMISKWRFE